MPPIATVAELLARRQPDTAAAPAPLGPWLRLMPDLRVAAIL